MIKFWQAADRTTEDLASILSQCLDEISSPAQIPTCLDRHPEHRAELEPLLRAAFDIQRSMAVPINEERRLAARRQFMMAAARQSQAAPTFVAGRVGGPKAAPSVLLRPLWSAFAPAAVAAALFVIALVPIMSITSVSSLPGDWNYSFKRSTEQVRLALTLNPADRLNLELAFHSRHLGEIERLAAAGRLDSSVLRDFTNESSALVQSVSSNPQLGPSEALKVVEQTQAQVQALNDKIAPLASASLKPDIATAVEQSQQVQLKASEVAQAKADSSLTKPAGNNHTKSGLTIAAATATPTATPDAGAATATTTATATATAQATATATATSTATAPAAASGTAVTLVPPAQSPPTLRLPPAPAAPILRPPTIASPTPTPLVPPSQPPVAQEIVAKHLPAGQTTTLIYSGPELPIPQALASISGAYDAVFYTQPREHGGQVYEWYPGQSDPSIILEPGSQVSIHVKPGQPATLTFGTAPEITPR